MKCFPDNSSLLLHGWKFSTQTPRRCSIVCKHLFRTNRFQNLHNIIRLQWIFIQNLLFSQPGLCTKQQTNSHQPIEKSIDKKTLKANISRSLCFAHTYLLIGRIQQENHQNPFNSMTWQPKLKMIMPGLMARLSSYLFSSRISKMVYFYPEYSHSSILSCSRNCRNIKTLT